MTQRFVHTILLLLLTHITVGQVLNSPIRFTNYTVADGLPSNMVNDIMEDSRGFVWMNTVQGLVRFDGNSFSIYTHSRADSNSMPFDDVTDCIELNNHQIVFRSGLKMWMLNPYNGRQQAPPNFWNNKTQSLPKKISTHLIAIYTPEKIYFTDMNLNLLDSVFSPVAKNIFKIFYLGNNEVLFTDNNRFFCYSLNSKIMKEWNLDKISFLPVTIFFVKQADTASKRIYLAGYSDGVYTMSYNPVAPDYLKGRREAATISGSVIDVLSKDGGIIVSCEAGLTIQQAGKPEIILKNIPSDNTSIIPGGLIRAFAGTRQQYWIAGVNGVSYFNLNQINYKYWQLPYDAGISHYCRYADKIWMSSENAGSLALDTKTNNFQIIDSSIIKYCWGAVPVNNQIYLYGNSTSGKYANGKNNVKLLAFNPSTNITTVPSFIKSFYHGAELITLVYQSKNGEVWYSINYGNGLIRQKAGSNECTQYRRNDEPSPFVFGYLNKAAEDKNGNIYFSVNKSNKLLVWKKKAQQFETWQMDSLLERRDVYFGSTYNHIIDSKQNLWISYQHVGLVKFNLETKKTKLYETADGLPYNDFDNMVADAGDNIWFPTPKGLCCLLSATDKFVTYTEKAGLPFTDFSNSYLFFDKDDSSLYFSKHGYLYCINTYTLLQRKKESGYKLFIDGMQVNSKPYYFENEKNIRLSARENNLFFNFVLLDLEQSIQQKDIEYLLTRNNNKAEWQKLNGISSIAFTAMQPGNYTLQVRLLNEATGNFILGSNPFKFAIATVWYRQWWFIILCFGAGIFITWNFVRLYYQRQIQQQKSLLEKEKALEEERIRIAADMHDDVGAGLSRIRYIATAMKEGKHISNEDMDRILSLSDESVEKMNEIIWSLNQGNQQLAELIYHIRSQCAEMVNNANIEFTCNMPDEIPAITLDWKQTRNIYLLAKEAVNNAIKHAAAKNIAVNFFIKHALQITVKDDGNSFDENTVRKEGNGLLNYKKRVETLGGTYTISSSPGKGTELKFVVPMLIH